MSALLLQDLRLDVVFDRLCDLLSSFVEATIVFVALRNPDGTFLEFRYDRGRISKTAASELPQQRLISKAMASERGFINDDPAGIFVPLQIGDEVIGMLSVESGALNEYSPDDLMLLESIAPYVAVAIRNRMLYEEVAHEKYRADHDPLTGLANRALFYDRFSQAVHRADRSGEMVGLIYADLDGFKSVNDRLGHAAGDELLRVVAKRFTDSVRSSDTVARMGGDEFAVIAEGVRDRFEISKLIEKLDAVLLEPIALDKGTVHVDVSIGHSLYPVDALELSHLLERADSAMYAEKARHPNLRPPAAI